ncbi:hypothetical protein Cgig2_016199 [Carnegiea gigantea]|uniref:Uncharacterized protein n=1 Tax=Carnegiea gigantea TaxID=171969 RepID=A0A9Q1KQ52_9CARY|nr:hypothetical protein Cgig2_016199 [Carnegiea gigantea]
MWGIPQTSVGFTESQLKLSKLAEATDNIDMEIVCKYVQRHRILLATHNFLHSTIYIILFDMGTHYRSIPARGACAGFVTGYMTFMSIAAFQSYIEEMNVRHRERLNGTVSMITGTMTWYTVKFRPEASHCIFYCLTLFASVEVVASWMMVLRTQASGSKFEASNTPHKRIIEYASHDNTQNRLMNISMIV